MKINRVTTREFEVGEITKKDTTSSHAVACIYSFDRNSGDMSHTEMQSTEDEQGSSPSEDC
jgi:hypothetical protein